MDCWELWRTRLCDHGPWHECRDCPYAHSLRDLRAPDESDRWHAWRWQLYEVDRFYGQAMSEQQLRRIRWYYRQTPMCDVPVWAQGLCLLETQRELSGGYAYEWDFGLARDMEDLLERRRSRSPPFRLYQDLWPRLEARRLTTVGYTHPPHPLGLSYVPDDVGWDDSASIGSRSSASLALVDVSTMSGGATSMSGLSVDDHGEIECYAAAPSAHCLPMPAFLRIGQVAAAIDEGRASASAWLGDS